MRALKKKPADRYPTVKDFAQALEEAVQKALQPKLQGRQPLRNMGKQTATLPKQPTRQQPIQQPPIHPPTIKQPLVLSPIQQPQIQPPPTLRLPPLQLRLPAGVPAQQNPTATTLPLVQKQALSSVQRVIARPIRKRGIRDFFEFSPRFVGDPKYDFFRGSGIALNVLSAIVIGLLLLNYYALFGGLIFSLLMFWLCQRMIEKILAIFFGTAVAFYWLLVGWIIGRFLASFLHLNQWLPPLFISIVFFGVSLSLHIWYVLRRN